MFKMFGMGETHKQSEPQFCFTMSFLGTSLFHFPSMIGPAATLTIAFFPPRRRSVAQSARTLAYLHSRDQHSPHKTSLWKRNSGCIPLK